MELKKYTLDFEKAYEFVSDDLKGLHALGDELSNHVNFKKGIFFTLLPDDAAFERLYDFDYGEMIPQKPYKEEIVHISGIGDFVGVEVISIEEDVANLIWKFLSINKKFAAIFDSFNRRPSSPHLIIENVRLLFKDEKVYYLLDKNNTENEVLEVIRASNVLWHRLGIIFKNTNSIPDTPSDQTFEIISQNVRYIIVGAYDGEGFVFWESQEPNNEKI